MVGGCKPILVFSWGQGGQQGGTCKKGVQYDHRLTVTFHFDMLLKLDMIIVTLFNIILHLNPISRRVSPRVAPTSQCLKTCDRRNM